MLWRELEIELEIAVAERRLRETTNRRAGQYLRRLVERIREDAEQFERRLSSELVNR